MSSFYLASKSPRRKELLELLGLNPTVLAFNGHTLRNFAGDEEILPSEAPEDYVIRTAREKIIKALAHIKAHNMPLMPVLSADTTVICQGRILGKPNDAQEAASFLRLMSGSKHEVRTAVFVGTSPEHLRWAVSVSHVYFKHLTEEEIQAYIALDEPYDKAGGYGIQGLAGAFIEHIEGSYTGIMGLPIFETCALLKEFGIDCLEKSARYPHNTQTQNNK